MSKLFNDVIAIPDAENPVIVDLPEDIVIYAESGLSTANVSWTEPTTTDNSNSTNVTSSHSPGELFPIGVTVVEYTTFDSSGNNDTQTFTVTVIGKNTL